MSNDASRLALRWSVVRRKVLAGDIRSACGFVCAGLLFFNTISSRTKELEHVEATLKLGVGRLSIRNRAEDVVLGLCQALVELYGQDSGRQTDEGLA